MSKEQDENENENISRRTFMVRLSLGLAGLSAVVVSVPVVSALLAPLLEPKPRVWRKVGAVSEFPVGTTKLVKFINADPKSYAGMTDKSAAWIRHDSDEGFTAFAANCTHLGCPVRWEEKAHLFMCPCHGGVYYKDGTVAAGPPPKSLPRYEVRVRDGKLELLTGALPVTTTFTSR